MSQQLSGHKLGTAVVSKIFETSLEFKSDFLFPQWADAAELITLSVHGWLVKNNGKIYLIDTGIGNGRKRPSPRFSDLDNPFLQRLAEQGVTPEQVDYVLITHIHTDHVGWNTSFKDGKWVPTFPNARYVFPQQSYQFFLTEQGKTVSGYAAFLDSVVPIVEAGLADFIPASGGVIDEVFEYFPTPGHCTGHTSIRLTSGGEQGLFAGDVIHNLRQIQQPQLACVFCEDKPLAEKTRLQVLEQVARDRTTYFSSHFSGSSVGTIEKRHERFIWQPVEG
ncbi:MBL fold metallo-hydrolase [Rouxiella badensis]|jgi:glyoxylase-like metal-dependent hydrolase (beta-lactamase superfamily II)|uniref:MBL fold metallo-hydrolase n=1 Tax=Rouxiella badensis TaxID=1646377 RepID=UPI0013EEEFE3|nr:MBL fold metallo-hydrolase [Rouxiella badensis]QII37655.1 MBL fold metallo-hydrolase [Rouxiella badensis]